MLIALVTFPAAAMPYTAIEDLMLSVSPDALSASLSYSDGLLRIEESETDDVFDIEVAASVSPIDSFTENPTATVNDISLSVTTPDDDTTITAGIPFSVRYDGEASAIHPSLGITHTFDYGHDDRLLEDLENEALRLSVESEHSSDIHALRRTLITLLSDILNAERTIAEREADLDDIETEMENALALSLTTTDSLTYREMEIERQRAEDSLSAARRSYGELTARYRSLIGIGWDGVEDIPEPVFPDITAPSEPSRLKEAIIQAEIAEEEALIRESELNPERFTIGGTAEGTKAFGKAIEDDSISVIGTLSFESGGWTLSASGGGTIVYGEPFQPSLTISGSWRSGNREADDIELRSLRNTALIMRAEASDIRRETEETILSLQSRISEWRAEDEEMDAEIRYRAALVEMAEMKLERGMITADELDNERLLLSTALIDKNIHTLEGLALQSEAEEVLQ